MASRRIIDLQAPTGTDMALVTGSDDWIIRRLEECFDGTITVRGDAVKLSGPEAEMESLSHLLRNLFKMAKEGTVLTEADLDRLIGLVRSDPLAPASLREDIILSHKGRAIRPKTAGQKDFVDSIRSHSITFGLGPAGTGKTFLAVAMAVSALKRKEVGRIVLTRPIVEAGENLGFLPGTMMEKVDPYIRPLYDALFDLMDGEKASRLLDEGTIEITPLAFMRGRTFNDSFVILDEAQNTTSEQMKMFLTRLGFGSKMVITGDESQSDSLKGPVGIRSAREHLSSLDDIAFCEFTGADVVRNSLVARIVAAYDSDPTKQG